MHKVVEPGGGRDERGREHGGLSERYGEELVCHGVHGQDTGNGTRAGWEREMRKSQSSLEGRRGKRGGIQNVVPNCGQMADINVAQYGSGLTFPNTALGSPPHNGTDLQEIISL